MNEKTLLALLAAKYINSGTLPGQGTTVTGTLTTAQVQGSNATAYSNPTIVITSTATDVSDPYDGTLTFSITLN